MWIKPLPRRPRSRGIILILFVTVATGFFSFVETTSAATVCACYFRDGTCQLTTAPADRGTCQETCFNEYFPGGDTANFDRTGFAQDDGQQQGITLKQDCTGSRAQTHRSVCVCYRKSGSCEPFYENTDATSEITCSIEVCKTTLGDSYSDSSHWDPDESSDVGKQIISACEQGTTPQSLTPGTTVTPPPPAPKPFISPKLNVEIPDLSFSKILDKGEVLEVNYLADYISAIYKFLLGAAATIAIVMIMIGGFQYVLSSGGFGDVKKGKERIKNAITGLIILMGVSIILSTVNPQLVLFKPLTVSYIKRGEDIEFASEEASTRAVELPGGFRAPEGKNIRGEKYILAKVPANLADKVEAAAKKLEEGNKNYGIYITDSFRSPDDQKRTITGHCDHPPAPSSKSCDKKLGDNNPCVCKHKFGKSDACMLLDGDPRNCPHTTGAALDVWGQKIENGNWKQCIKSIKEECSGDKIASCRANPCQAAAIAAMKEAGFCVLDSEPWHFEQAPDGKGVSSNCH